MESSLLFTSSSEMQTLDGDAWILTLNVGSSEAHTKLTRSSIICTSNQFATRMLNSSRYRNCATHQSQRAHTDFAS